MNDETNFLSVLAVCDGIFKSVYVACVTYVAIMFDNPKILAWWILAALMGYRYRTENKEQKKGGSL